MVMRVRNMVMRVRNKVMRVRKINYNINGFVPQEEANAVHSLVEAKAVQQLGVTIR
jgi:hypothetical protein